MSQTGVGSPPPRLPQYSTVLNGSCPRGCLQIDREVNCDEKFISFCLSTAQKREDHVTSAAARGQLRQPLQRRS